MQWVDGDLSTGEVNIFVGRNYILLSVNLSLLQIHENEVTKRLASYAALIAVPTMIAGLPVPHGALALMRARVPAAAQR